MLILFEPEFMVEGIEHYINELDNQDMVNIHILEELKEIFPDPGFSFARVVRDQEGEIGTNFYSITVPDQRLPNHLRRLFRHSGDYVVTISGGVETESRLYFETFHRPQRREVYRDADLLPQAVRDELRLNGKKLDNIALTELNLDFTDYTGVTFKDALIPNSTFINTQLICANFSDTDLRGSNFQLADLRMAILTGAHLDNAILTEANLKYAHLDNASLRGANLTGADLRYTNLINTDLRGCILNGTLFWGSTWGEGTRYDENTMADAVLEAQPDDQMVAIEAPPVYLQPQPQFQGVAFEVHNAFDKINMDRYMEIINTVIDDTNVADYKRDIIGYVKRKFTEKIEELEFTNKATKLQELENVLTKLGLSDLIRVEHIQIQIGKTVDYVLLQSPAFIELYIDGFIEECAHAYAGQAGLSCVKGIVERFIMFIGSTLREICRDADCSQDKLDLLNLFIDINVLLKAWTEEWQTKLKTTPDAWFVLTNEERKADFINFLTGKYTEAKFLNDDTKKLINDTATKYDYVFTNREDNDIAFGGRRKKIKRERKHKTTKNKKKKITRKRSKKRSKMYKRITTKKRIKTIKKRKNKKKTNKKP